jgi:protocatechuate 3,4-dioxygenase beta subunit
MNYITALRRNEQMYLLLACLLQKSAQEDTRIVIDPSNLDTAENIQPTDDTVLGNDTAIDIECPATTPTEQEQNYREHLPIRNDLNVYDAQHRMITIRGITQNTNCEPARNLRIQVWHADQNGQYDSSEDFQYYGEFISNSEGFYEFFTIYPGAEQIDSNQYNPVQIHIKVIEDQNEKINTTIYFSDDPFLAFGENIPEENIIELIDDGNISVGIFNLTF